MCELSNEPAANYRGCEIAKEKQKENNLRKKATTEVEQQQSSQHTREILVQELKKLKERPLKKFAIHMAQAAGGLHEKIYLE